MNSKTQKRFSAPDPILGFICKDHVTKKRRALGTTMPQTPGPAPLTRPGRKRVAWSRDLTIAFFVTQKSNVRTHAMETVIFVYQKKCRTKVAIDHFRDFFSLRKLSFLTSSCLILKLLLANHRRSRFPELLKPGLRRSSQGTSEVSRSNVFGRIILNSLFQWKASRGNANFLTKAPHQENCQSPARQDDSPRQRSFLVLKKQTTLSARRLKGIHTNVTKTPTA